MKIFKRKEKNREDKGILEVSDDKTKEEVSVSSEEKEEEKVEVIKSRFGGIYLGNYEPQDKGYLGMLETLSDARSIVVPLIPNVSFDPLEKFLDSITIDAREDKSFDTSSERGVTIEFL